MDVMIHRLRRPIVPIGLLAFLVASGLTFSARAQAGGVHFDPESPAGKEYALPLSQARKEALGAVGGGVGGEGGGGAGPSTAASLFGAGIGGGSGGGSAGHGGREARGNKGSVGRGGAGGSEGGFPVAEKNAAPAIERASYSSAWGFLLLAGILILGIGLGFGLRALDRHQPSSA